MSSVGGHSTRRSRSRKFGLRPPHKARSLNDDASVSDSLNSDDQIFASGSSDTSNMDDTASHHDARDLTSSTHHFHNAASKLRPKSNHKSATAPITAAATVTPTATPTTAKGVTAASAPASPCQKSTSRPIFPSQSAPPSAPASSAAPATTTLPDTSAAHSNHGAKHPLPLIVSSASETMPRPENRQREPMPRNQPSYHPGPPPAPNSFFMPNTRYSHNHNGLGHGPARPNSSYGGRGRSSYDNANSGHYGNHQRMSYPNSSNASTRFYRNSYTDPTPAQWAHDKHADVMHYAYGSGEINNHPGSRHSEYHLKRQPESTERIDRSLSSEKHIGNVRMRVAIPGMPHPKLYDGFRLKQYTKLPDHRPPLRRDKPVQVRLPGDHMRLVLPANDRSFDFIPRALRPNQQKSKAIRQRSQYGSMSTYSRAPSIYGGASSFYSASLVPSLAASRRSSIADVMFSPAAPVVSRPVLPMSDSVRLKVKLPPPVQSLPYMPAQARSGQHMGQPPAQPLAQSLTQAPAASAQLPVSTTAPTLGRAEPQVTTSSPSASLPPLQAPLATEATSPSSSNRRPSTDASVASAQQPSNPTPPKTTTSGDAVVVSSSVPHAQATTQPAPEPASTPKYSPNNAAFQNQFPPLHHFHQPQHPNQQIPERAIHAPVFQPGTRPAPPPMYSGLPQPPPPPSASSAQQPYYTAPNQYSPVSSYTPVAPYDHKHAPHQYQPLHEYHYMAPVSDPMAGPQHGHGYEATMHNSTVSREINGMTYYYNPSQAVGGPPSQAAPGPGQAPSPMYASGGDHGQYYQNGGGYYMYPQSMYYPA
ncbi:uncharacterized protein BROUX77_005946 [Berkeleyomyces rouxiae]|uniref:uncharacterized protein n=1 Tax=Berkeleyomyces rouxiae TaxID=2035830 RepID=UPI003B81D17F